jgi:preprotein translocase subunit Sec61beta
MKTDDLVAVVAVGIALACVAMTAHFFWRNRSG